MAAFIGEIRKGEESRVWRRFLTQEEFESLAGTGNFKPQRRMMIYNHKTRELLGDFEFLVHVKL